MKREGDGSKRTEREKEITSLRKQIRACCFCFAFFFFFKKLRWSVTFLFVVQKKSRNGAFYKELLGTKVSSFRFSIISIHFFFLNHFYSFSKLFLLVSFSFFQLFLLVSASFFSIIFLWVSFFFFSTPNMSSSFSHHLFRHVVFLFAILSKPNSSSSPDPKFLPVLFPGSIVLVFHFVRIWVFVVDFSLKYHR